MNKASLDATIAAIWRIESPRLIAALAHTLRDVGRAEEIAQDAFVTAMQQWPDEGIPRNPGAWLMTAAKRRAIDAIRREKNLGSKLQQIGVSEESYEAIDFDGGAIDDDLLRLMFVACHPVLSQEARVALTLRLLGGLTAAEIARAFLVSEPAIGQRISRAKRALAEARVPFEVPEPAERPARLGAILEALYLIFNEGYSATSGDNVLRPELVEDALRLGRVLARLLPHESEVHGLIALMELQASRSRARIGRDGEPVLLPDQDRTQWNRVLIARGLRALEEAQRTGKALGPYGLQAAIAACHANAATAGETDWPRIVALYDALVEAVPSPVIELNRAVAVGMAFGPQAALDLVERLAGEAVLSNYSPFPSVRADLLQKLGRYAEAREDFRRAAALTQNERQRALLLAKAQS